ncbi:MAG: VRR-NUC domain-containing protein [Bacteroidales bacterium]|jgi:hypothetical protein|nr:VRR-NUC domain-containing protein [Bacteroidales bacterium]
MRQHIESNLQQACVTWFRLQYRQYATLLYAVPNGGSRNKLEAVHMKREGIVSGVSDLNLDVARQGYHGLRIEMKTKVGRQSENQKDWQEAIERQGYLYVVCRSFEQFMTTINNYLG